MIGVWIVGVILAILVGAGLYLLGSIKGRLSVDLSPRHYWTNSEGRLEPLGELTTDDAWAVADARRARAEAKAKAEAEELVRKGRFEVERIADGRILHNSAYGPMSEPGEFPRSCYEPKPNALKNPAPARTKKPAVGRPTVKKPAGKSSVTLKQATKAARPLRKGRGK